MELEGLNVEFIHRHGHFMVLSSPEGLTEGQLSPLQASMLKSNDIPHLLPVTVEEMDGNVRLYYNISGKKMLSHMLKQTRLSFPDYVRTMLSVVTALDDCRTYMLLEAQYVLQTEYMFCGTDVSDIYLTYVPLERLMVQKKSVPGELQQLSSQLLASVDSLQGERLQEIMTYLHLDGFHIAGFKKILLEQLMDASPRRQTKAPPHVMQHSAEPQERSEPFPVQNIQQEINLRSHSGFPERHRENLDPSPVREFASTPESLHDSGASAQWHEALTEEESGGGKQPVKLTVPVLAVAALSCALCWKWYAEHPSEPGVYIAAGLTVLIAGAAFYVLRIWRPQTTRAGWKSGGKGAGSLAEPGFVDLAPARLSERGLFANADVSAKSDFRFQGHKADFQAPADSLGRGFPAGAGPRSAGLGTDHAAARNNRTSAGGEYPAAVNNPPSLSEATTYLTASDATVWLGDMQASQQGPFLEKIGDGQTERIPIAEPSFVIGRGGNGVHYIEDAPGVSRAHVEFMQTDGHYMVKDLGSKNGSFLNGEQMVPYKVYSLKEGDTVKIIAAEFIFKMGS
ncbi:DUF6382 domain-containing protein [Paenibacillus hamazuiensis]|uniref:DUF6382 domain-containing protein n=1 Tax=Paenibacillus hamazuiensis TaxID=2936508 RepID=UPI0020107428|nr:DUF6382 domain-containing protein [Paenibacillus hamazuiensis]